MAKTVQTDRIALSAADWDLDDVVDAVRKHTVHVDFSEEFKNEPHVALSVVSLHGDGYTRGGSSNDHAPFGFSVRANNVTTSGFDLSITTLGNRVPLLGITIDVLAMDVDRI